MNAPVKRAGYKVFGGMGESRDRLDRQTRRSFRRFLAARQEKEMMKLDSRTANCAEWKRTVRQRTPTAEQQSSKH